MASGSSSGQQQQHPRAPTPATPTAAAASASASASETGARAAIKRPLALNGISSTVQERSLEFLCPICFDLIREAHVTRCGHTFCFDCIVKTIDTTKRCPKCNSPMHSTVHIFPNYLLGEIIAKHKSRLQSKEQFLPLRRPSALDRNSTTRSSDDSSSNFLKQFITSESEKLALPDVTIMLEILSQRKQLLEAESTQAQNRLLYDFLSQLLSQKQEKSANLAQEIALIQSDMAVVQDILASVSVGGGGGDSEMVPTTPTTPPPPSSHNVDGNIHTVPSEDGFNSLYTTDPPSASYLSRKRRMHAHFDDFVTSYFSVRSPALFIRSEVPDISNTAAAAAATRHGLDVFRDNIVKFSRYNSLRPLASMHYSSDLQTSSTIVSTIVFDKDNEFFAIGGVTKRIKVFDYMAVIRDTVDIHYPSVEMTSNSKISCIAWNSYHKNILASSDYEGIVSIWDVISGIRTQSLHEHEKRCWSVDFNEVDTRLIASGSDDSRVKLWSTNDNRSIATLEAKANVCCVKFNPKSSCHLAFGSADHDVHYYDLRNMSKALCVFKGHKKAVSYVKFMNTEEIISASTDSQLKLWNVNSPPHCLRTFKGHLNEKNFVGLTADSDYVACGSEDNSVYVYYKGLSKQLFSYNIDSVAGKPCDTGDFVSAVCWRKDSNVLLAANSKGLIKIFELV